MYHLDLGKLEKTFNLKLLIPLASQGKGLSVARRMWRGVGVRFIRLREAYITNSNLRTLLDFKLS